MGLAKFLLKLGLGVTSLLFGAIGLALGLGRVLFWPLTDFMDPGIIASVAGGILLVVGIMLLLSARGDLQNPDFLQRVIMRSMKKSRWTNTLCPTCFWWMQDDYVDGVRTWVCVNPNHSGTKPIPEPPTPQPTTHGFPR